MKKCTKCGETKPLDEFGILRRTKDGHDYWCKECKRKQQMDHYYSNESRRKNIRVNSERWYEENPDKVEEMYQKQKDKYIPVDPSSRIWVKECIDTGVLFVARSNHRVRCPEAQREYTLRRGREKGKESRKNSVWTFICDECGKEHTVKPEEKRKRFCSDKCLKRHNRRIARAKRRSMVIVDDINPFRVFRNDKFKCQCCGCKVQKKDLLADNAAELDHIVPVSLGGPHSYNNIQTLCRKCNQEKSNKYEGQLKLAV